MKNDLLFTPRVMLKALKQNPTPKRYLQKTFFGHTVTHATKAVDLDIQKTKRQVAGFVNPAAEAKAVERAGFITKSVTPAYLKEKVPTRVGDLLSREIGKSIYDDHSPQLRAAALMGEDLRMLDDRFNRREELMCRDALIYGKIEIKGEGLDDVVDFGYVPGEHVVTLSGTDLWDNDDSDPMRDLNDWRIQVNKRSGLLPNRCIVGEKVYWAIMDNPKVKERLDTRRIEMGLIDPKDLPEGIRYLGYLKPSMIDIFVYDEWYTDPVDGEDKPLIPEDVVLLGSSNAYCTMNYGLIQNTKHPVPVPRFPSSWEENDGRARFVQLESAPLPCLSQPDAFLVAHVLS